jgi:aminoglycoside phosphotransferase (APT) family kinase protein
MTRLLKPFTGYSGAQLIARDDNGVPIVRKVAKTPDGNERLSRQMRRQQLFHAVEGKPFRVPQVFGDGYVDDRYYFDMELVNASDSPSFLATADCAALQDFGSRIISALRFLKKRSAETADSTAALDGMAQRVYRTAKANVGLTAATAFRILERLNEIRTSGGEGFHHTTWFHGDFSLENVLVTTDGDLVLIDFLDSPLEHYWQDVAKLSVDLRMHWYARRHRRISEWAIDLIRGAVDTFAAEDAEFLRNRELLIAINLIRILPYSVSSADRDYLVRQIEFLVSTIA